ncbi:hypothetical protein STEG23_032128, partial [Scotinomys teguina]
DIEQCLMPSRYSMDICYMKMYNPTESRGNIKDPSQVPHEDMELLFMAGTFSKTREFMGEQCKRIHMI